MGALYFLSFLVQSIQGAVGPYLQIMLRNSGYSHILVGTVMGAGLFLSVVGPLLFSYISQKTGKPRLVMILSALAVVVFFAPVMFPVSTAVTIVCYCLGFVSICSINPLHDGYITTHIPNSSYYGRIRACGTMGYVSMLVLSAVTSFPNQESNSSIFLNMGIKIGAFVLFCLLFLKPDKGVSQSGRTASLKNRTSFKALGSTFYLFIFLFALTRIAHGVVEKLLASYMTEVLDLGNSFTFYIALGAMFEALVMVTLGKKTSGGVAACINMLVISSFAVTIRLLIYFFFPKSIIMFSIAQAMHGLTYGMAHISATAYIATLLGKEKFTLGMGVYQALGYNLPEMIAVTVGGFVIDYYGYPVLFASYSVLPLIAIVLIVFSRKKLFYA